MKNFKADYATLISNIINEVINLLNEKGLTELTIFEGHPWDENNRDKKLPVFHSYRVYDDSFDQSIQKLIKCNGMWGFVLFDDGQNETLFPKELAPIDMDFQCANTLYECVYKHLHPKRRKSQSDIQALEELKKTLGGE